ncbi:MAG: hypothetical protein WB986_03890 [Methanoregula sp.]|uniref:hypothetical protein n=1 Tax=Methanoregula sp. TaxID=2052170 RepID=UPI003C3A1FC8
MESPFFGVFGTKLHDIARDKSDDIVKGADLSLSITIISVPYMYFQLPFYQMVPQGWYNYFYLWLLIGGILMICSLIKEQYYKVSLKCPKCKNATMKRVSDPKWECTFCGWKQP